MKEDVLQKLRAHQPELQAAGIGNLYLFGSVARGEATATSDVDLVVRSTLPKFTFSELFVFEDKLTAVLGKPVDLIDYRGFEQSRLYQRVKTDLVEVF